MKTQILTRDKSFYRSLVMLALPVALQNLITFLVSFADNNMVNRLGDVAVSAVYMGSQIQVLLQMFMSGICGTIVIIASQYWGKKDIVNIRNVIALGFRYAIVISISLALICMVFPSSIIRVFTQDVLVIAQGAEYLSILSLSFVFFCISQLFIAALRCVESASIGLKASFLSLVTNIILNYILIYGKLGFPALGVKGAAIATLIARIVESIYVVYYVFRKDKRLNLQFSNLSARIERRLNKDFLHYGTPLVLGEIVWSINMMANSMILGRYGASVITAASIANTMNTLAYVTIGGLATALGIITGKTIGKGDLSKVKEYAKTAQAVFLALGLVMGLFVASMASPFVALYGGVSTAAAQQAKQFVYVLSITIMGTCYQMPCLFGLVKSGGDVSFVFKNDTIFVFFVVLPSAIIASFMGAKPWIVFACLKCDQVLKCFVAVVKINRYDWIKKLT